MGSRSETTMCIHRPPVNKLLNIKLGRYDSLVIAAYSIMH